MKHKFLYFNVHFFLILLALICGIEAVSANEKADGYATLPFSFNDGKDKISKITGLTQYGLGDDYSGSAYAKLKFDGTGDYVLLKFNSAPIVLSYSIMGSSFSGGTFKVQYSDNGSSYIDLKSYTALTKSTYNEAFYNIPTTARYIKWIYTSKSYGNVGLGNIKLVVADQVTIGSAGYTTHVTGNKISFPEGLTAYIVSATEASSVTLTSKASVPANTPIVIKGDAGTYNLPSIATTPESVTGNQLQASDGSITGDGTIYALGKVDGVVGFYRVDTDQTVPSGKAYLTIPAGVKEFLTFDFDTPTAVQVIERPEGVDNAEVFNLAGQRIENRHRQAKSLQRGVYIVNGRKVLVK